MTSATANRESRSVEFPPELLHEFVSWLIVEYIDDAIAGPLALPSVPMPGAYEPYPDEQGWSRLLTSVVDKDPILGAPNPVLPLFQVSFGMREITLRALSALLAIPVVENERFLSLETKPWTVLEHVRLCFSNPHALSTCARQTAREHASRSPLLHTYTSLGQTRAMERVLWYRQEQLLAQRGGDWRVRGAVLAREFARLQQAAVAVVEMPARIADESARYFVARRVREDMVRLAAGLVYKVSVQMVKFVQDTIEMLDKQRASIGVPAKHDMDKLLLAALGDMQQLERAALELPPHIAPESLPKALDRDDLAAAHNVLNVICKYTPHPTNAEDYERCQEMARVYVERVETYL